MLWEHEPQLSVPIVSLTAVFSLVMQRGGGGGALRDETKDGYKGDWCSPSGFDFH